MRTFLPSLFCLGMETKGAKFCFLLSSLPLKQVQRLCSAGHTALEIFPFQTATQIFLTSMKTLLSFHCCRKIGLSADGNRALPLVVTFPPFLLFCEIVSHPSYYLPICSASELHLGRLLIHSLQTRYQCFSNPLQKSG